jgi:hypothetical protein
MGVPSSGTGDRSATGLVGRYSGGGTSGEFSASVGTKTFLIRSIRSGKVYPNSTSTSHVLQKVQELFPAQNLSTHGLRVGGVPKVPRSALEELT